MKLQRLTSLVLVCSLVLWLIMPTVTRADDALPPGYDDALKVLSYFHLVSGDATGYRPMDTLTRAEVAKLAVGGMAMADQASYYSNTNYYQDVRGHWAQGYIGLAHQLSIMSGYPDGTFRPDARVSYAEAIALIGRVGGLGATGEPWPFNWVHPAQDAGILDTNSPYLSELDQPARRADIFVLLYRTLTGIKDYNGSSLLQRRFKPTPPNISVDPFPVDTQDTVMTITGTVDSAVSVAVNGTPTTLTDNHFSAQVPLKLGVNTIAVTAQDIAGNSNLMQQQVVRENTAPATITISGPHTFPAGQNGHLDIVVKDSNGAPISNLFNLVVDMPGTLGSFDPYSGTLYAPQASAQGTMTFTMGTAKATWDVTIGSGNVVKYKIVPENPLVKRGDTVQFGLTGVDQYGNPVDVSALPITWQCDAGCVINAQGLFAPAGNGTATVTAVVGGQTITTQATVYGPAAQIGVIVDKGTMTANKQDTLSVTLQAQDANGNMVPDYSGTFYVSSTAPGTFNPTASTAVISQGQGTITVQAGSIPGSANLIVTANQLGSGTALITVSPQNFSGISLSVPLASMSADGTTKQTLTVTAVDTHGQPLLSPLNPPLTVHLVGTSPSIVTFDSTATNTVDVGLGALDPSSGTVAAKVTIDAGTTEGHTNISGRVSSPSQYAAVMVRSLFLTTVHVGSASKLSFDPVSTGAAGGVVPLYVHVLDGNGNQITNATSLKNVALTLKDQNGTIYPATVSLVQGNGRAEFDTLLYKATTYTFTATATASGSTTPMMPASQSVTIAAGPPVSLSLAALPSLLNLDGVSHTTITATVQDAYGNIVPTGSYSVRFVRMQSNGATGTFKDTVVSTTQGKAQVVVPSGTMIATDLFTATTDGLTTRNSVSVDGVIMGVPSKLGLRYGDNNGDGVVNGPGDNQASVGTPVTVYVDILDNNIPGYIATTQNGEIITLYVKNLSTGDQQVYTAPVQYGTATFTFTKSQATSYALQAGMPGVTSAGTIGLGGTLPDLVLHSGSGAALALTSDLQALRTVSVPGSSYATLTASLVDGSGNPAINNTGVPINVTLKASNTTYGYFTADGTPTGPKTDTVTVAIPANSATSSAAIWYAGTVSGPVTITANADQFASGMTVVTAKTIGPVVGISVQPIAPTTVQPYALDDNTVNGQDVKASVVDEQGQLVNDYGFNGEQISLTTTDPGCAVVAYYDYPTGTWKSLDQQPGNGVGDYPSTDAVTAYKGQAWFRARSSTTGTCHYVLANASGPQGATVTLKQTGTFVAGALSHLTLIATPSYTLGSNTINPVAGGGRTITVTAEFVDPYGNVITNQVGTVYFQLSSGQYGTLLSSNTTAQNGKASAVFQSTSTAPLPTGTFQITAYTPVTQPGGAPLTSGSQASPASITITEDSIAPTVQTVAIAPGGTADQKVTPGDYFTVNFSKTVNAGGIFSSLTPGTTLATGLSNLRVFFNQGTTSDTITFGGGLALGTITLQGDSMSGLNGQSSVAYGVSSVSMSADGTQVTVVLGSPQGSASPIGLTLSSDPTKSTFAPSTSLTDLAGNAMVGTPVNLNASSGF